MSFSFSFDSWPWKFAIVLALLGAREFVRLLSPKEAPHAARGGHEDNGRWLIETLDSATIAIGLVLFVIQPFILQAFFIPSGSMRNTLLEGDRLLVSKTVYRVRDPRRGDVIVFHAPPEAHPERPDDDFIKRCIGTPGDTIEARGRTIFVNGVATNEPYQLWDIAPGRLSSSYDMKIVDGVVYSREYTAPGLPPGPWLKNLVAVTDEQLQQRLNSAKSEPIPPGKYLMLGDHRNNSNDGHNWGLLDGDRIVGKAVCVFWPPTRLGLVDRMSSRVAPPDVPAPPVSSALPVAP